MSVSKNKDDDPPFLHEIPFGLFVCMVSPFALLLALTLSVSGGLIHATQADLLWAVHSARAVSDAQIPTLTDSTVVTLKRSMCYGWCPEYTLKLSGSGKVEYDGRAYVCAYGVRTGVADPREVSHLVQAMIAMGYFGYSWQKGDFATDSATVTTSLQHDERRYELAHYHGDQGAPEWLRRMEDEIDRVAGTRQWRAIRGANRKLQCPTPDGGMRELTL